MMAEQPKEHVEEQPLDINHTQAELERKIVELAGKDQEINDLRNELEAVVAEKNLTIAKEKVTT